MYRSQSELAKTGFDAQRAFPCQRRDVFPLIGSALYNT